MLTDSTDNCRLSISTLAFKRGGDFQQDVFIVGDTIDAVVKRVPECLPAPSQPYEWEVRTPATLTALTRRDSSALFVTRDSGDAVMAASITGDARYTVSLRVRVRRP